MKLRGEVKFLSHQWWLGGCGCGCGGGGGGGG